ncbi:hypothetical protein DL93DRAFT_2078006 [Clavulina sp. PMI_390]|nr:hypothetical protein DL93DRAFT_2078006 [Clavulina sp. PMI_390]
MAMTAGGEVLVVWTVPGLLVIDFRHTTTLALHFAHPTINPPSETRIAVALAR